MCLLVIQDCKKWEANLSAFVVMSNHIHLIARPHESKTIVHLMSQIKANSCVRMSSLLLPSEKLQLDLQSGLGGNTFWKRSPRAFSLHTHELFCQKIKYLHDNPVRQNLVELPEDYQWSSMYLHQMGLMIEGEIVDLSKARNLYQDMLNKQIYG